MQIDFRLKLPVVGIGAPAGLMLRRATERLGTELVLPEDFRVANAVGAITGSVVAEEQAHIRPIYDALGISGYSAHTSTGQHRAEELAECIAWSERAIRGEALKRAAQMGAADPVVEMERLDSTGRVGNADRKLTLEVKLIARATGRVSMA
jgi:N-methylhydantoinase A/oxoprolinase/acetone carboxylase beta subunit